jgi:hypothetical protein
MDVIRTLALKQKPGRQIQVISEIPTRRRTKEQYKGYSDRQQNQHKSEAIPCRKLSAF